MDSAELKTLLSEPNFDPLTFLSNSFIAEGTPALLKSVNDTIKSLDSSIFQHVASHYKELLKMTAEIDNFHNVLQVIERKVIGLSQSMEKLKKKLNPPYQSLKTNVCQFRRLQITADLLRKLVRTSVLVKRIQSHSMDVTKHSACLNELDYLFSVMDWEGVHLLESYKRTVDHSREDMVNQAWGLVNTSFETSDQIQLGLGLQVSQNLGMLPDVVFNLIKKWQTDFSSNLASAIDVNALSLRARNRQSTAPLNVPGRVAASSIGGQTAAFYVTLWTSLDGMMDHLDRLSSYCRLLGSTLLKYEVSRSCGNVTPAVHLAQRLEPYPNLAELLLHHLVFNWHGEKQTALRESTVLLFSSVGLPSWNLSPAPESILAASDYNSEHTNDIHMNINQLEEQLRVSNGFVEWAFCQLSESLLSVTEQSSQIKEALDGEYPKLLKLVLDLGRRVSQLRNSLDSLDQTSHVTQSDSACYFRLPDYMLRTLQPFETSYLSRSLSRLFDQVSMAFASHNTVDSAMIDGIVQSAVSELAFATVHCDLLYKVSRNVAKTVALFTSKVESLVSVGPVAVQLTDVRNSAQENNINLINLLCSFGRQLELGCNRRLRNLPVLQSASSSQSSSPFTVIHESLESRINVLCLNILQPLLESVSSCVEGLLSTMHTECYATPNENGPDHQQGCSDYLKQLQDLIVRVRRQYLSGLSQPSSALPPISLSLYFSDGQRIKDTSADLHGIPPSFVCGEMALQVALQPVLSKWVDVFLYNITLVRPVNDDGCLRLAADCAEFELALAPILSSSLGTTLSNLIPDAYKRLKAFRPILLTDTPSIVAAFCDHSDKSAGSELNTQALPPSLVCQHLFSRAPEEIRSPHDAAGWSTTRYVTWIVTRANESERLAFLRNGLAAYVHEVQRRQQREYAPMYVLIKKFLHKYDGQEENNAKNVETSVLTAQ